MAARREEEGLGFLPVGLLSPTALRAPKVDPKGLFSEVTITAPDNDNATVDPKSGAVTVINDDGTIDLDFSPQPTRPDRPSKFDDNLAEVLSESELGSISAKVLQGIQEDEQSRQPWLDDRAQGIRILGLKLEGPRSSIDTTAALEGMSNVRDPALLEAVLNFWANASGELLPATGPVKIADKLTETGASNKLAEQLEEDFNYYLTLIATEYYPDTSRALLQVGFGGLIVKKVYNCPLRQRPVSESVDAVNIIVSNAATDLRNSGRYTHLVTMRPSVLRRMQLAGAYRDVPITVPSGVVPNVVQQQIAQTQGVQLVSQQTEDREHTIYECYCELDIPGFEDKRNGKPTGLALPYRVVIDKDSTQVLEIRRNWKEDDETKTARDRFVVFVFVPGFGFYGIGLLHILGNMTNALTAATRETLDAGMFANFPGFLYSKLLGRQNTNEFRVPPGGGMAVDTSGGKLTDHVMALPYKDVSVAFVQFQEKLVERTRALGGTAQVQVSEGRQDAPVGTTLAMLEQATKVEKATHKELWRAQNQEFQLLKECFRENPGSFIRAMRQRGQTDWDEDGFIAALNDASLVPQADPNTPSHMHRLMKAMGLIQLDKAYPGIMDPQQIVERVVNMLGFGDFESLKNKNPQQGMPPQLMLEMQKLADKSQDRDFKMAFEQMKQRFAVWEAQNKAAQDKINQEFDARMEQMRALSERAAQNAEAQQHAHERELQDQESADQHLDRQAHLRQSENDLEATRIETAGDIRVEELREKTEDTKGKHATAAARAKPKPKVPTK